MRLVFSAHAWEDYLYWQRTDRKILQRINTLIREIQRTPFEGIGKPEPLKHGMSGYWSRRINDEHRTRLWPIKLLTGSHGSRGREPLEGIACTLLREQTLPNIGRARDADAPTPDSPQRLVPLCDTTPSSVRELACSWLSRRASRVTSENSPNRTGVVRVMAFSDHWRWVSKPEMGPGSLQR